MKRWGPKGEFEVPDDFFPDFVDPYPIPDNWLELDGERFVSQEPISSLTPDELLAEIIAEEERAR